MSTESKTLRIHLLPPPEGLPRTDLAVIVDVLRASTTIASALHAGAECVVPCLTIEAAREAAVTRGALLGGERGGVKVDGFDFGNSPTEYCSEKVAGKTIAFTTTNGTKALQLSLASREIVIGAFANLSGVTERCAVEPQVDIVCAGTDGAISAEDVLFAGLLGSRLTDFHAFKPADDATGIAIDFSRANTENPPRLLEAVRQSQGGKNLIKLGYDADIQFAANIDRFSIVPTYDAESGSIRAQ